MAMEILTSMGRYPTIPMRLGLNLIMGGIGVKMMKDEILEL